MSDHEIRLTILQRPGLGLRSYHETAGLKPWCVTRSRSLDAYLNRGRQPSRKLLHNLLVTNGAMQECKCRAGHGLRGTFVGIYTARADIPPLP
jgi:hypothetical protein